MSEPSKAVDDYIEQQPEGSRAILRQVRAAIRTALPDAEEIISYRIPAYRIHGRVALFFAGWTQHFSVYPVDAKLIEALGGAPPDAVVNDRGTIRFPLDAPVPAKLIGRIANAKAKAAQEAASKPKRKST